MSNLDSSLYGLNMLSIDQAKKTVENVQSWEDARDYAERSIKDLKFSLKVFTKMIADGVPWSGESTSNHASRKRATRN
jgi:hypothetical protein